MGGLKVLAKELYFANVSAENFRENFVEKLNTHKVVDKRNQGFWCSYCKTFAKKADAFVKKDWVIFRANQIWIVNAHYDGCRGWD